MEDSCVAWRLQTAAAPPAPLLGFLQVWALAGSCSSFPPLRLPTSCLIISFLLGTHHSVVRDTIYCLLLSRGSAPWNMTVSLTDTQKGPAGIFTQGCFTCVPSIPRSSPSAEWQACLVVNDMQCFFFTVELSPITSGN